MPTYARDQSIVFCKTTEPFGGFSNMAGGFPLHFDQHDYWTSEHLYQCLRFPNDPQIQALIRQERSPMCAKMKSKKFRKTHSRPDWDDICIDVMRFCLRLKLHTYPQKFGGLLRQSAAKPIVEESRRNRDDMWSARASQEHPDILEGQNTLGLLLMELRREFLSLPQGQPMGPPDAQPLARRRSPAATHFDAVPA